MTNRQFRTTALLLTVCAVFMFATGFQSGSMALVFKIVQDVTKKTSTADWTKALKGENLSSGDQVKTGTHSLAIVKFLDNSILRVREQSVLTVSGEGSRGSQVRTIQINAGAFGFDVKKQKQNEQFRLTSPTSVASIRGTKGTWSGGRGNDTLVVVEGLVNLRNSVSNKDLDIPAGYIGFSNSDGSLSSRHGTAEELADASASASGVSLNELNLELKDAKGNRKELKLKYHR
jgi:hypothetical protein